jgi:hypothetical protein
MPLKRKYKENKFTVAVLFCLTFEFEKVIGVS